MRYSLTVRGRPKTPTVDGPWSFWTLAGDRQSSASNVPPPPKCTECGRMSDQSLCSNWSLVSPQRPSEPPMTRFVRRSQPAPVHSQPKPRWIDPVQSRLESLARLQVDWDSYGAKPVESSRSAQAYDLLQHIMDDDTPAPILVPTSSGSIQIEWHTLGVELDVSLLSDTELDVCFEDLSGEKEPFDGVMSNDVARLRELTQLLASRARVQYA